MKVKNSILVLLLPFCLLFHSAFAGALRDLVESPDVKPVIAHNARQPIQYDYNIAVAAIFQDEAPYLREWIEFYKLMGVQHFYLYNNLSTDNYLEVLQPYIDQHVVDLIEYTIQSQNLGDWDRIQLEAYQAAFNLALGKTKWLAIIDVDEFFVPVIDDSLTTFLARFEDDPHIGGVCAAWVIFGTSHIQNLDPNRLMIEQLVLNGGGQPYFPWQQGGFKSIVRPDFVSNVVSPHYCLYKEGYHHIGLTYDLAQINHYWTRDEEFLYRVKIPRRILWGFSREITEGWVNGMHFDTPYGKPILRFVPKLRQQMGLPDVN